MWDTPVGAPIGRPGSREQTCLDRPKAHGATASKHEVGRVLVHEFGVATGEPRHPLFIEALPLAEEFDGVST